MSFCVLELIEGFIILLWGGGPYHCPPFHAVSLLTNWHFCTSSSGSPRGKALCCPTAQQADLWLKCCPLLGTHTLFFSVWICLFLRLFVSLLYLFIIIIAVDIEHGGYQRMNSLCHFCEKSFISFFNYQIEQLLPFCARH